ncbi:NACHT domain-containing protein [Undibacterium sp. CY18W]|uniref:NACHT domain-containing protein n=1 Tax=Undibacterium hunanense TaxID=2762292 RepID=A0ABR6ZW31_9BURK|nr:NACHT domain-containing protein [Undibacterium hunanense]MBC3920073.1 NACHT domain-containing protein [Undibacterium hunanense]
MNRRIKRSAIPASGYMYQTLVGIRLLCEWLDNPGKYEWVQFEADDLSAARGLDDIVAKRSDQLYELIQVKFTVSPLEMDYALSWDWLTERSGKKGKSLLEKWSSAAFNVGLENTADLRLITNRRPDAIFNAHLLNGRVDIDSLPLQLREQVEVHVGGNLKAVQFFERFEFSHSYADYESLDRNVSTAMEGRHTDHLGWLALCRRANYWSVYKNAPSPDGRITLEILRSTISEQQPRPLNQEFRIPDGYLPPNPEFADDFLKQAEERAWDLRVLWGSPGQGKSTFLSYVCKRLEEQELPFIRHHYFLNLQDSSERLSLKNVAHSLITQMQTNNGDIVAPLSDCAENLRAWISACGAAYASQGKRFFVIIDGLDHVWRENDQEIAPLESLFAQLLPLPTNTTLILGSQRVDKTQLPKRLNHYLESNHWVELPRMHLRSINAWLLSQYDAGLFKISEDEDAQQLLQRLSSEFERVSEGHPLVLTYAFMKLVPDGQELNLALFDDDALEPKGDVRAYYNSLWQRLSWEAKDALHLMAEDGFIWPSGALESCLNLTNSNLETEIGHLMAIVDAGLVAFHGSLYVFISAQPKHNQRVQELLPNVLSWLETSAPPYLKWAWLWLYQSRIGNNEELIRGTTRSWVVEALVQAYPSWQIYRILTTAEEAAFLNGNYEQAIRKRALKNRLNYGLDYQVDNSSQLRECALRLTKDNYPALLLASEIGQSSISDLYQLAMLYLSMSQTARAKEVQGRMRQRINDMIHSTTLETSDFEGFLENYLEVAAGTGQYESKNVVKWLRTRNSAPKIFSRFLSGAGAGNSIRPFIELAPIPMPIRLRRILEIEAIRTSAWSGAKLHEWNEFKYFKKHPLSICWRYLHQGISNQQLPPCLPVHEALNTEYGHYEEDQFSNYLHFTFFALVARVLQLNGAPSQQGLGILTQRKWLGRVLGQLAKAAHICGAKFLRGEVPEFSLVYQQIRTEHPSANDHHSWSDLRTVKKTLVLISADIFFLSRSLFDIEHVSANEWAKSKESVFFADVDWRELILARGFQLLPEDVVASDIEAEERAIHSEVRRLNEKCSDLSSLCNWAVAYGLTDIANRLLASTYRCGIGYGWRKDHQVARLLEAVDEVSNYDVSAAVGAINKLAAIYTNIDEMTESSDASKSDLAPLLLKLMPEAYVRYYRFWLDRCEWYSAENTFAVFAKKSNLADPVAQVSAAFLWDSQTQSSVQSNPEVQVGALLIPWKTLISPNSKEQAYSHRNQDVVADISMMPLVHEYPPNKLQKFLLAVDATKQYTHERKCINEWFVYWAENGDKGNLLSELEKAFNQNLLKERGADLFDLVFPLSLKLQGAKKAFRWLVEAHRYKRGWSPQYYGNPQTLERIALVAKHYRARWSEFVVNSAVATPNWYRSDLDIPDVALVSLLLQVGEIARAVSVLQTLIEITLEEFEMQPLKQPLWLQGVVI